MKKTIFKPIMMFLFCSLAVTSCFSQELVYEPIGISDKPLPIFRITTKKHQASNDIYVIDKKTFSLLKNNILGKKKQEINEFTNIFEYGSYKVTYTDNSKKITYYIIDSKQKSRLFFKEQLKQLKPSDKLYNDIEILLKRIN